jgi:hypothetical protein
MLLASVHSFAQNPGYMGRRFVAGYGIYASPGFYGSGGLSAVNLLHEGFVEYAFKKNASLVLSAKFYKAVNKNEASAYDYQFVGKPGGQIDIKARNYAFYMKFYKRHYLAPWGRYLLLGPSLNTFDVSYDPVNTSLWSAGLYGFGEIHQKAMTFDIMFGNGRSRVIANRIVIDYGYKMGVWGMTSFVIGDILELLNKGNYTAREYNVKTARQRVNEVNRFNIYFKVGYLF